MQQTADNERILPYENEFEMDDGGNYTPTYYYTVKVKDQSNSVVSGATVVYKKNGVTVYTTTTNSSGKASYTEETTSPSTNIVCTVSKTGYNTISNISVSGELGSNISTPVTLSQTTTTYYYVLYVKDATSNEAISGASVKVYSSSNTTGTPIGTATSDADGKATYSRNNDSSILYFKVEKNGYTNVTGNVQLSGQSNINYWNVTSHKQYVNLEAIPTADYWYVISVKNDSGQPVEGVKVRLYRDFSYNNPYGDGYLNIKTGQADDELIYTISSFVSGVTSTDIPTIKLEDRFKEDLGIDSIDAIQIINEIDNTYNISTTSEELSQISTVGQLVEHIKSKVSNADKMIPKTVHTTDSNGLIVKSYGSSSTQPSAIYAKGGNLPTGNTWNISQGKLNATKSNTLPGLNLSTKSYDTRVYYHNFIVIDDHISVALSNTTVKYYDSNNTLLAEKTSDANGKVTYSGNSQMVYVLVEKDGFETYGKIGFNGSEDSKHYTGIRLSPLNTVRVIYETSEEPAINVPVIIFNYDSLGKYKKLKECYTYSNGYIETLEIKYYNQTSNVYVSSKNKIYNLTTGDVILTIPYDDDIDTDDENEFEKFNDLSINSIKKNINEGNLELEIGTSKKVSYNSNDFRINIVDPDSINTYDIFASKPVMVYNDKKNVIGSVDVGLKSNVNKMGIKIINRYSGYYNPIFKDIVFYNNLNNCSFSNTSFDSGYSDNYGKFGVINNMWFHKVNDNKKKIIKTLNPNYPLMGQYALDYRDYNIFESNWDENHYTRQVDFEHSEPCQNISSMKNGLCMLGSKYLNVPNTIEIFGLSMGDDSEWKGEWNDDWITNPDACPGEVMFKEINNNSVNFYFFFKKRILRYFRGILKEEFEKYIDSNFSFGNEGVDDDIDEYVTKNILKLYKLDRVRVLVRRTKKGQHNSRIENDYSKYLEFIPNRETGEFDIPIDKENFSYFKQHGFVQINTVTLSKMNRDDFDRRLVYNLRNGSQEEFAFSFVLRKI